jgi:hypothetical protein
LFITKGDSSIHNLKIAPKIYQEISGINNESDSAIISTTLAQLRSDDWENALKTRKDVHDFHPIEQLDTQISPWKELYYDRIITELRILF